MIISMSVTFPVLIVGCWLVVSEFIPMSMDNYFSTAESACDMNIVAYYFDLSHTWCPCITISQQLSLLGIWTLLHTILGHYLNGEYYYSQTDRCRLNLRSVIHNSICVTRQTKILGLASNLNLSRELCYKTLYHVPIKGSKCFWSWARTPLLKTCIISL